MLRKTRNHAALCALLLGVTVTACEKKAEAPKPSWRGAFVESAQKIPFGVERAPEPDDRAPRTDYPPTGPKITFANGPAADTIGLSARITSDVAYPRIGLAPGVNYVWTDTLGGKARQLIIPADTTYPPRWLAITQHEHKAVAPRVIYRSDSNSADLILSYCTHCGTSGPPWCSGESLSDDQAVEIPVAAFDKYFAKYKVSERGN